MNAGGQLCPAQSTTSAPPPSPRTSPTWSACGSSTSRGATTRTRRSTASSCRSARPSTTTLEAIAQFAPPDGRLLLAWEDGRAFGIGCLRRLGPDTGEIKRMYVEPSHRGTGAGWALLDGLIAAAREAGYARIRLDSPDFLTDAHRLYRRRGFRSIEPYPESEIPADLRVWWVFMERPLLRDI